MKYQDAFVVQQHWLNMRCAISPSGDHPWTPGQTRRAGLTTQLEKVALFVSFFLTSLFFCQATNSETPVNPDCAPGAQALFAFLQDINGKKVISGQHEGWRGRKEFGPEIELIRTESGRLPALLSLDLAPLTSHSPGSTRRSHEIATRAAEWYLGSNGIVSLCWHWDAPVGSPSVYVKQTSFDLARAMLENTPEHEALLRDLDVIGAELQILRDKKVPVLWRPLHEANGRWFWWGGAGPEPFKKLWRLMFDRFAGKYKLNNLIWVFSPGAAIDLYDWYPGDAYVDIIAPDHYPMDGNHDPAKDIFEEMIALGSGTKLVAYGENGPLPDPNAMQDQKARWLFFLAWSGKTFSERNTAADIQGVYTNDYVLKLGDLPDLKSYSYHEPGSAVALSFSSGVPELSREGGGLRPLTVSVRDARGIPVRVGKFRVELESTSNGSLARLSGQTVAETVNGIAELPALRFESAKELPEKQPPAGADLKVQKPGAILARSPELTIRATAGGLAAAVTPQFSPGPGDGIIREIWLGEGVAGSQAKLQSPDRAPTRISLLDKGFSAPFDLQTNFVAHCRGYLMPQQTGEYCFSLACEGRAELWLGTSATPERLDRLVAVSSVTKYAKWPHTREAQSPSVTLQAGKRYAIELTQTQPAGPTHFCVSWRLPDGSVQRPIPASRLYRVGPGAEQKLSAATVRQP